ncbi:MAG: sugar ABC transporter ATP-binding protein [Candidatus Izemoplasma sp.]
MKEFFEMKNISIEFPGVKALDSVDFKVTRGEVHALIGANGAGKSTLMKVLGGVYNHFTGEILLNGEKVNIKNPHDAKKHGILVVYQEVDTALVPNLSVAENIMLDHIINDHSGLFINWKEIRKEARKIIEKLGLDIDVTKLISDLTLSEKQMVLIGRAVFQNAKYLILDEPTAPLSIEETSRLFDIVRTLKKQNVAVIFISHRLDEIFEICEHISILRDGKKVGDYLVADLTINDVIEKMLGKKLEQTLPKIDVKIGDKQFIVENLTDGKDVFDINLHVNRGEIVGIAGLVGAGKTELCKLLFGAQKITNGKIYLNGKDITPKSAHAAVKSKMALVPEERRKDGILVNEDVETNLTLPMLSKFTKRSFMNKAQLKEAAISTIKKVGIKTTSEKQKVANLSGGNQQKVAIGKWIISDADIFIFDEPTKGVDVGSKADIYKLIGELAEKGKSIIYASCEFPEILGLTDRTYVMYDGKIAKELVTKDSTEEELLYYSTGGGKNES